MTVAESNFSTAPSLVLGQAMPDAAQIPMLSSLADSLQVPDSETKNGWVVSVIQEGWQFKGTAHINGACSIAGTFEGTLLEMVNAKASVVVTETGVVEANVHASHASVMGVYSGTLNVDGGKVQLHAGSTVSGHIRYGQLLVNGADLNATLERVSAASQSQA